MGRSARDHTAPTTANKEPVETVASTMETLQTQPPRCYFIPSGCPFPSTSAKLQSRKPTHTDRFPAATAQRRAQGKALPNNVGRKLPRNLPHQTQQGPSAWNLVRHGVTLVTGCPHEVSNTQSA